jgi:hypothetical protein
MAKSATVAAEIACHQHRIEKVKQDPAGTLRRIEYLERKLSQAAQRLDKVELDCFMWLPGTRLPVEQHEEIRNEFAYLLFTHHIPADWQEYDGLCVRKQDYEQARELAMSIDPQYVDYMDKTEQCWNEITLGDDE